MNKHGKIFRKRLKFIKRLNNKALPDLSQPDLTFNNNK